MGLRVRFHGPESREWRRHPGAQSVVSELVWVKVTSSGRWIQCGGTMGQDWTSLTLTPVATSVPANRPAAGTIT